jgi:hypothetical protein
LHELQSRFAYVQNVVKYCEDAYPTGDKTDVSSRAEGYIIDALQAVSGSLPNHAAGSDPRCRRPLPRKPFLMFSFTCIFLRHSPTVVAAVPACVLADHGRH